MSAEARVVAHCSNCSDTHPVSQRPKKRGTTKCPICGDTGYESEFTGETIDKSEPERILEAIEDVYGVGEKNSANIVNEFSTFAGLQNASVEQLVAIDGVGQKTAEGIKEKVT